VDIKFAGGEADTHSIDLYEGAESLAGFGRVTALVAHYVATGEVRFRAPYSSQFQFQITGTEQGSLKILVRELSRLADQAQAASQRLRASALLRRVVRRATGNAAQGSLNLPGWEVPEGTVDALSEAATPGLQRAHRWIDREAKSIYLNPDGADPIELNSITKQYLENEEISLQEDVQDVSVGALNVNSRNGRVFFHDLGRTVPFWVPKDATDRTIPTLSRYLTQYAEKTGATVNIRFKRVSFPDGRLKRLIVSDCYSLEGLA